MRPRNNRDRVLPDSELARQEPNQFSVCLAFDRRRRNANFQSAIVLANDLAGRSSRDYAHRESYPAASLRELNHSDSIVNRKSKIVKWTA